MGDVLAVTIPGTEVEFTVVWIPGGTVELGSPAEEVGRDDDEGPVRTVRLSPFWMGTFEVTNDEYSLFRHRRLDGDVGGSEGVPFDADAVTRPSPPYEDPSQGMGDAGYPAVGMTRWAALHYARWLSLKTGRLFRLPTEAEWEYACRAGASGAFAFGSDVDQATEHAWFEGNSDGAYHPGGGRQANRWGLHDMHGNVAEWVMDEYDAQAYDALSESEPALDPVAGRMARGRGIVRGGAFDDPLLRLRCAERFPESTVWKRRDPQVPKSRWWNTDAPHVGFRLVSPSGEHSMEDIQEYWARVLGG